MLKSPSISTLPRRPKVSTPPTKIVEELKQAIIAGPGASAEKIAEITAARGVLGTVAAFASKGQVPLYAYNPSELEVRSLPCDEYAELNMLSMVGMYSRCAQEALIPVVSSMLDPSVSTPSSFFLQAPAGIIRPAPICGVLVEFSVQRDAGILGSVTFRVKGAFDFDHDGTCKDLFDSGTIMVAPRTAERKIPLLITPYKVVNGKTYVRPLMIATDMGDRPAQSIEVEVIARANGVVVEAQLITPTHVLFSEIFAGLAMKVFE